MSAERLRVLVVEDEFLLSMLLEDMLNELGCEVVGPAATVAEALSVLAQESPDCAILDVNVAGVDVYPVAEALRERAIPYVFSTGYEDVGSSADHAGTPVLRKPYRMEQLSAALAELT